MARRARDDVSALVSDGDPEPLESVVPIPKQQLYEKLSRAIIEQILAGILAPSQRLPPERELARAFGVSRPSLREALGALQTLGVVETRHGSGSWISADAREVLAARPDEALDLGIGPVMLLEARVTLEPVIASLAAQRYERDPELERLLSMLGKARDWQNPVHRAIWTDADRLYHQRLAGQTHNAVFIAAADFIASVQAQPLWRRLRDDTLDSVSRIEAAIAEHEAIFDAVRRGDAAAAAEAASRHLDAVRDSMGL